MHEQWTHWKPLENLESKYYCVSLSETMEGFNIILGSERSEREALEIRFEDGVLAYAKMDESFTQARIAALDKRYSTDFYGKWTLFKVENSEYTKNILEESHGWSSAYNLMHFVVITEDSIIDIVSDYEPIVETRRA